MQKKGITTTKTHMTTYFKDVHLEVDIRRLSLVGLMLYVTLGLYGYFLLFRYKKSRSINNSFSD